MLFSFLSSLSRPEINLGKQTKAVIIQCPSEWEQKQQQQEYKQPLSRQP